MCLDGLRKEAMSDVKCFFEMIGLMLQLIHLVNRVVLINRHTNAKQTPNLCILSLD